MSKSGLSATGHTLWSKIPKANSELFALTYGSLLTEILRDYDHDILEVNHQLEKIGYSIGIRCIDELLAKCEIYNLSIPTDCKNLKDTADVIAKVGFRMFLGMNCEVGNVNLEQKSFSIFLADNPLSIFVELPTNDDIVPDEDEDDHDDVVVEEGKGVGGRHHNPNKKKMTGSSNSNSNSDSSSSRKDWRKLKYSNVYCGVIRGALEQVNLKVECDFVRDVLQGDDATEIKVQVKQVLMDGAGEDYHEE